MSKPTVFISYSHTDEAWKDRLVTHLRVLEKKGCLTTWDDRRIGGGDDWYAEIQQAMDAACIIVPMISANFLTSDFILNVEVTAMLERKRKAGVRIMPLIVKPCAWNSVNWLKKIQARPKDGRPLSGENDFEIDTDLAAFAKEIHRLIKRVQERPQTTGAEETSCLIPPEKIDITKLPVTGATLFGREKELDILDTAWEEHHTTILSFVAWGGVGKSALINDSVYLMPISAIFAKWDILTV